MGIKSFNIIYFKNIDKFGVSVAGNKIAYLFMNEKTGEIITLDHESSCTKVKTTDECKAMINSYCDKDYMVVVETINVAVKEVAGYEKV